MSVKILSRKRIDGFMALLDAFAVYLDYEEEFKVYQKPPLINDKIK